MLQNLSSAAVLIGALRVKCLIEYSQQMVLFRNMRKTAILVLPEALLKISSYFVLI